MSVYENEITPDDWLVSDMNANADDDPVNYERKLRKAYDRVKAAVKDIDGLSVKAPDFEMVMSMKKREKSRAVSYDLTLTKSDLSLTVGTPTGTRFVLAKRSVPTDLEAYRDFLEALMNWSDSDHPLVTESEFKNWSTKNPKNAAKPTVYKTYDDMLKKSKTDAEAFKAWAKSNSAAKKAMDELAKTDKLKPTDAARIKALKAVDAVLPTYYKSF